MKHLILLILFVPILLLSQITEDKAEPKSHNNKLYAKGSWIFGPGFESVLDNIEPGGGQGFETVLGYDWSKTMSIELSIGMQNSGDHTKFKKSQIRASAYYKIPIEKKFTPYLGAGISAVLSAKYIEKSSSREQEATYSKPIGIHILGGVERKNPYSPLFFFGEVRLLILGEFELDKTDVDFMILREFGMITMKANGLQWSVGIGYYIN